MSQLLAGRKLDMLVAEKVMGWTQMKHDLCGVPSQDWPQYLLPHYSTDIAAAFQVVDKLLDGTRAFVLECFNLEADRWRALFKDNLDEKAVSYKQLYYAYAGTRPLAICHAALKVVGGQTGP